MTDARPLLEATSRSVRGHWNVSLMEQGEGLAQIV
jgi:hypothetical protein